MRKTQDTSVLGTGRSRASERGEVERARREMYTVWRPGDARVLVQCRAATHSPHPARTPETVLKTRALPGCTADAVRCSDALRRVRSGARGSSGRVRLVLRINDVLHAHEPRDRDVLNRYQNAAGHAESRDWVGGCALRCVSARGWTRTRCAPLSARSTLSTPCVLPMHNFDTLALGHAHTAGAVRTSRAYPPTRAHTTASPSWRKCSSQK